jgi:hypothetical protein
MNRHPKFLSLITLIHASNPVKNGRGTPGIAWAAACLLVLFLCSASATPPQDQATLYFFNTSGWTVFPGKLMLLDNDKMAGGADREQYISIPIAPGHHALRLKGETSNGKIEKTRSRSRCQALCHLLYCGRLPSQLVGQLSTWTFAEITKEEAEKYLAEMKPQAKK